MILTALFVWLLSVPVSACDVCGCSASGSFLGILPQYNRHFVGLSYQYQSFTSSHPVVAGEVQPQQSEDYFQSLTAWGRFYPFKRVQVFMFIPYQYNYVQEGGSTTFMQGIGDIRMLINYMVLTTPDSSDREWRHNLLAGGGIKAPVGRNDFTNREGIILSNMQPGTGSWDFLFNTNYTLRYRKTGINLDALYQMNSVNNRDYRYGDKLNAGLSAFMLQETGVLTWQPQAGLRYQFSGTDESSYQYRIINPYSGGSQLYFTAGIGVYYKRTAITLLGSIPLWEHYAGGLVNSHNRYEIQFQYIF